MPTSLHASIRGSDFSADAGTSLDSTKVTVPNLIVIGAMKSSTTTFYELITQHPAIWFSAEKEPHYFTSADYGRPGAWEDYQRLFTSAPSSAKYIGEASTGYSKLPHFGNTPQRLQETLVDPHLIYLVRDPVSRTISNFQHSYLAGHYQQGTTLSEAIQQDPILIDASCYARQIRAYHDVFDPSRLLIITTDRLHSDPKCVMREVETFLDVPEYDGWDQPLPKSNSKQSLGGSLVANSILPKPLLGVLRQLLPSSLKTRLKQAASKDIQLPEITESDRQLVFDHIADDLRDLQQILGNSISGWPSVHKLSEG